jgi:hypothetical protein
MDDDEDDKMAALAADPKSIRMLTLRAAKRKEATQTARETYPPRLTYLLFLIIMNGFLSFEPFAEISSMQVSR